MGKKSAFSNDWKLMPSKLFVGMKFGYGHAAGRVGHSGFTMKCIAPIYTGRRLGVRQFTALI